MSSLFSKIGTALGGAVHGLQGALGIAGKAAGALTNPVGTLVSVAAGAARAKSPFTGVVPPGGNKYINQTFGLGYSGKGRMSQPTPGYHLNKHKLADGTPARTVYVRNRHMNPANGRAIARAARRIHKGEKLLRKIFTVEGHHHGAIKPRRRGKR